MKKINFKFLLAVSLILVGSFYAFNVKAADSIEVETTGYSILGPDNFVFGGYYSGNSGNDPFTTYFEYKKGNENLDIDAEKTIPIVREGKADQGGNFYTSPELAKFSIYYFRAVGYLNSDPTNKIYGSVMSLKTGDLYIPVGAAYPFTVNKDGSWKSFQSPNCVAPQILNTTTNTCEIPPTTCTLPEVYSFLEKKCKDLTSLTCGPGEAYSSSLKTCMSICTPPEVYSIASDRCVNPTIGTTNPTNPGGSGTGSGEDSGFVKCGTYGSDGKINNPCDFDDVMAMINNAIKFIFTHIAIPIAALSFAYAGFEMMTSGGNTEKKSRAVSMFTNVAIGLVVVAASYLIVQTVLVIMGYNTGNGWYWFGF